MMKKIILIVLFVVSLLASENEETGVPYIDYAAGQIDSAVLAPDGKSFYTLQGDLVNQWQLSPIKKLISFKTGMNPKDERYRYHIHVTSDNKKMLIRSENEMVLWDLTTQKLIKRIQEKQVWGISLGANFLTINKKYLLKKWDMYSLRELESFQMSSPCSLDEKSHLDNLYPENCLDTPNFLLNYSDKLVVFSQDRLLVLDSNKFKVLRKIAKDREVYTSVDKKFLYFSNREPYELDLKTNKLKKIDQEWLNKYKAVRNVNDILLPYFRTNEIKTHSSFQSLFIINILFKPTLSSRGLHRYCFYDNNTGDILATFYPFKNGEWILIQPNSYFDVSPNAHRYLKEKNNIGKEMEISKQTYKKYYRKINLGDKTHPSYNKN